MSAPFFAIFCAISELIPPSTSILKLRFFCFRIKFNCSIFSFALSKSFELFCYLAAKLGAGASKKELCEVLFADASYSRRTQDYFSKAVAALKRTLEELGAPELFLHGRDFYAVRTELLQCDAYECLRGEPSLQKIEPEYFMTQYGWAQKSALMQELMQ